MEWTEHDDDSSSLPWLLYYAWRGAGTAPRWLFDAVWSPGKPAEGILARGTDVDKLRPSSKGPDNRHMGLDLKMLG